MTIIHKCLSNERSNYLQEALDDEYEFCKGRGVISLLGESTKHDYNELVYCIEHNLERSMSGVPVREYIDEIMENKWFIHVYDLNGAIN